MDSGPRWKTRIDDDGAARASEGALRTLADTVVGQALRALRQALVEGELSRQWRAEVLLELVRMMRRDLQRGGWTRLAAAERLHLRRALLVLGLLASSGVPLPVA